MSDSYNRFGLCDSLRNVGKRSDRLQASVNLASLPALGLAAERYYARPTPHSRHQTARRVVTLSLQTTSGRDEYALAETTALAGNGAAKRMPLNTSAPEE